MTYKSNAVAKTREALKLGGSVGCIRGDCESSETADKSRKAERTRKRRESDENVVR